MRISSLNPAILDIPGTVLIDDRDLESGYHHSYLFMSPEEVITATTPEEVIRALQALDKVLGEGKYAAGYIAYEAGLVLDKEIQPRHDSRVPLIWLGVYKSFDKFDSEDIYLNIEGSTEDILNVHLSVEKSKYLADVRKIKEYIAAGDVYQVNYTTKLVFDHRRSARHLFARLRKTHPVSNSAFINTGDLQIASLSPELFLRREGDHLLTRPMKGTARRGRWAGEDEDIAQSLATDIKNRAENLMIVDLMRNDIGRICETGSVHVPRLFHIHKYGSLFQMTSDVAGNLREETNTSDILKAVFPPGSITGAPKIRAMEIINELESEPRGVYCGSIGMFCPDGSFLLNVAIRTIVQRGTECEMGVGSGIVWDSDPESELKETMLKGKFLQSEPVEFELFETLVYVQGEGFLHADEHVERIKKSAEFLGWDFHEHRFRNALVKAARDVELSEQRLTDGKARVRINYSRDGEVSIAWQDLGTLPADPVRLLLSSRRMDPDNVFLYHKTTVRENYDSDLREAAEHGFFNVLYLNTRGELTECATMNIALEIEGKWFTPPLDSGLLPGVWRRKLLEREKVSERVLTLQDLKKADSVFVGNSVRGKFEVGEIVDENGDVVFQHAKF